MPKAKLWLPRTSRALGCLKNDVLWNLGPNPLLNVSLGCTPTSSRQLLRVWPMLVLRSFLSILRCSGSSCKLLPGEALCVQCAFCASPSGPFFPFLSVFVLELFHTPTSGRTVERRLSRDANVARPCSQSLWHQSQCWLWGWVIILKLFCTVPWTLDREGDIYFKNKYCGRTLCW